MKRSELVRWLKGIGIIASVMGLILCFCMAPAVGRDIAKANPELDYMFWPCLIFIWISAVPFYTALVQCWLICNEIQKDKAFCSLNVKRLKRIGKLALSECLLYFAALVILAFMDLLNFGILIVIVVILCIGFAIAIFSAVLSHLAAKAGSIQDENDLTI